MQRFSNNGNNLIKVIAPGNGDCFYHAVMIGIIYDVLTDRLPDSSPTAVRIHTVLLPEITKQLVIRGKPDINFSNISLKHGILELLRIVPISELPISQQSDLILKLHDDDIQEIKVIKNCDFYHLLVDICSPALRKIMLMGMQDCREYLQETVKEVLESEFFSYIITMHGDQLGYEPDSIVAAKNQFSSGELSDVNEAFRSSVLRCWEKEFNDNNNKSIKDIFSAWWIGNSDQAWHMYEKLHSYPQMMAGKPQHIALALKLVCNFKNINCLNQGISALTPEHDSAHPFFFSNGPSHFDAMISGMYDAKSERIANVLQKRMDVFNENLDTIKNCEYPWVGEAPIVKCEPFIFVSKKYVDNFRSIFFAPAGINLLRREHKNSVENGENRERRASPVRMGVD